MKSASGTRSWATLPQPPQECGGSLSACRQPEKDLLLTVPADAGLMRVRNGKQTADGTCKPVVFFKNRACQVRCFPLYSAHAK
jgi:hypothetical protein